MARRTLPYPQDRPDHVPDLFIQEPGTLHLDPEPAVHLDEAALPDQPDRVSLHLPRAVRQGLLPSGKRIIAIWRPQPLHSSQRTHSDRAGDVCKRAVVVDPLERNGSLLRTHRAR